MRDFPGVGRIVGRRRREYGPNVYDVRCDRCGAGWCGEDGDSCERCERTLERLQADQRRLLLDPPWLHSDAGHPRYDELSDVDRRVWDRTRGQTRGTDSVEAWAGRLARAVQSGLITQAEARAAFDRAKGRRSA